MVSGCSSDCGTFWTRMTAMSAPVSEPTTVAGALVWSGKVTVIFDAPETTCWSVRMSPFLSNTTPAPSPWVCCCWPKPNTPPVFWVEEVVMSTTPGPTAR